MTRISVINRKSIIRRLKKIVGIGLIGAVGYGGISYYPKAINQWNLKSNIDQAIHDFGWDGEDKALEEVKTIENTGFLFNSSWVEEKARFYGAIREKKFNELERYLNDYNYVRSLDFFDDCVKRGILDNDEAKKWKSKIDDISPQSLIKLANNSFPVSRQILLYNFALREFQYSKQEEDPTLRPKLLNLYVSELETALSQKWIAEVNNKSTDLRDFLKSNKDKKLKIISDEEKRLVDSSRNYLLVNLTEYDWSNVSGYLGNMGLVFSGLGINDSDNEIRNIALSFYNKAEQEYLRDRTITPIDVTRLDNLLDLTFSYKMDNGEEKIINLALDVQKKLGPNNSDLREKFLYFALVHSRNISEENQRGIKARVADAYVEMNSTPDNDYSKRINSYHKLMEAKGLYLDSGILKEDARMLSLDNAIKDNLKKFEKTPEKK